MLIEAKSAAKTIWVVGCSPSVDHLDALPDGNKLDESRDIIVAANAASDLFTHPDYQVSVDFNHHPLLNASRARYVVTRKKWLSHWTSHKVDWDRVLFLEEIRQDYSPTFPFTSGSGSEAVLFARWLTKQLPSVTRVNLIGFDGGSLSTPDRKHAYWYAHALRRTRTLHTQGIIPYPLGDPNRDNLVPAEIQATYGNRQYPAICNALRKDRKFAALTYIYGVWDFNRKVVAEEAWAPFKVRRAYTPVVGEALSDDLGPRQTVPRARRIQAQSSPSIKPHEWLNLRPLEKEGSERVIVACDGYSLDTTPINVEPTDIVITANAALGPYPNQDICVASSQHYYQHLKDPDSQPFYLVPCGTQTYLPVCVSQDRIIPLRNLIESKYPSNASLTAIFLSLLVARLMSGIKAIEVYGYDVLQLENQETKARYRYANRVRDFVEHPAFVAPALDSPDRVQCRPVLDLGSNKAYEHLKYLAAMLNANLQMRTLMRFHGDCRPELITRGDSMKDPFPILDYVRQQ